MRLFPLVFTIVALAGFTVQAAENPAFVVKLGGLNPEGHIMPRHAFCVPDGKGKSRDGTNISPAIRWSKGPEGTKSYAILMIDADVPTVFDDANQEGKALQENMPRRDFVHWVLVDMPVSKQRLPEGADSYRIDREGKRSQVTKYGMRGVNDYGSFMKGTFYGYDGPCPPWNDERLHHYTFSVYALDVETLDLKGSFTAADVKKKMEGHVLASASAVGIYTQNAKLIAQKGSSKQ